MGLSLPHLIVLALVLVLLFGRGRISEMMGDFGRGLRSFREGVADEAAPRAAEPHPQLVDQSRNPAPHELDAAAPLARPRG